MIHGSSLDSFDPADDGSKNPQATILPHVVPDPLSSNKQYARFRHLDIDGLQDSELVDERYALRPLLWGLPSDHWLRERVAVLESELRKRGKPK
jgi:hypothetical protein